MTTNNRAKIYFGNGGICGVSEIGRSVRVGEKRFPQKRPLVYGAGGVSVRAVLTSAGISRGAVVRVEEVKKPSVKREMREKETKVCQSPLSEVKMVGREARTIGPKVSGTGKRESGSGLSPREMLAVEYFERMEKMQPVVMELKSEAAEEKRALEENEKAEEAKPEVANVEESEPEATEQSGEVVEDAPVPELVLEEAAGEPKVGRRKKRRGKKGSRVVSTEVSEERRAEFQAAVEAASDAAEE